MKSNYKKLSPYIQLVDVRNTEDARYTLLGVSIDKHFIKSIANTVGTDWRSYKIIRKGQFCYIPDTSRRGDKMGIALLSDHDIALVSQAYTVFEIVDKDALLPEYLNLWFKRPEFDRYARFHSHGSVREIFDWEEMCNVELPIPDISEQQKIVDAYNVIERRISLKRMINDNLEATAQAVFQERFGSYYGDSDLPEGWRFDKLENLCTIKGGKRLPADCELLDTPTKHPYIRVRDVGNGRFVCLTNQFQYIDDETHSAISRYIVNEEDVVISIVGTIGLIGKVHRSLDKANLTENCVKLTDVHSITSDYLYYTLCYKKQTKEIELLTVGAVQAKLPMYNIQAMKTLVPPKSVIDEFQSKIDVFNSQIEANTVEIQRLFELQEVLLAKLSD